MALSFPVGRVLGIPIRVHASWFLVLALVTWTMSTYFESHSTAIRIAAGLASALSLFASVLLHELGHCVFARFFGIHVRRIQLFLFGGVAEIVGEPRRVFDEIVIAAAGPAVSFALALLFGLTAIVYTLLVGGTFDALLQVDLAFTYLVAVSAVNLALGLFNLVPAFPTDGGRILRAVLWGVLGDYRKATSVAAGLGMVFAGAFILAGVVSAGTAGWRLDPSQVASARVGGLWQAMIGIFLARSASQAGAQARISSALRSARVREVMGPIRPAVAADRTLLETLVGIGGPSASEMLLDGFPVSAPEGGPLVGFVEPARLHGLPREQWGSTRVADVMTPLARLPRVAEDDALDALLKLIVEQAAGALVFRGEALVGYASRADLARWLYRDASGG